MRAVKPEIRILGVDDAPFSFSDRTTEIVGCLFRGGTMLEAVLRSDIQVDGFDATEKIAAMLNDSRQHDQTRVIMLDGITFGGFNIVDIQELHKAIGKPVIAVSRNRPDRERLSEALDNVDEKERRLKMIERADEAVAKQTGQGDIYFQFEGIDREQAEKVIEVATTNGMLPEPLRVAHLIAAGVKTGESTGS